MRRLSVLISVALVGSLVLGACTSRRSTVQIGAVYPTGGGQGPGGLEEYHGVVLAAQLANAAGGVHGRQIRIKLVPADSSDQAPGAVEQLAKAGVPAVVGSYGSTISRPAADAAQRDGVVFWESGAVGDLGMVAADGDRVFRFAPNGAKLGGNAVRFLREMVLPRLGRDAHRVRWGVTYVDDVYGAAVGRGAIDEIRRSGLPMSGVFRYSMPGANFSQLAHQIAAAHTDVLIVAAYLQDAIAMRREIVRRHVPLVASAGTSSSYCMPAFGEALGRDAVGLYASDKPDGDVVDASKLAPSAARALVWLRSTFERRYHERVSAAALSGFSAAWALFHDVLPRARSLDAAGIARAARTVTMSLGALPNGSGLAFGPAGRPGASDNLRATSVIWEWIRPGVRAIVWPPSFATARMLPIAI